MKNSAADDRKKRPKFMSTRRVDIGSHMILGLLKEQTVKQVASLGTVSCTIPHTIPIHIIQFRRPLPKRCLSLYILSLADVQLPSKTRNKANGKATLLPNNQCQKGPLDSRGRYHLGFLHSSTWPWKLEIRSP